ncbi:hypothetical protein [Nonomuraea sp. NPDC005730]|uniref:hypothetical protein n=1 Tax=Nonomuraea sp. NPDC005730 TaxID=3157055 RepID=UPI0033DB6D44
MIGASRNERAVGRKVRRNLIDGGSPGPVPPVNPNAATARTVSMGTCRLGSLSDPFPNWPCGCLVFDLPAANKSTVTSSATNIYGSLTTTQGYLHPDLDAIAEAGNARTRRSPTCSSFHRADSVWSPAGSQMISPFTCTADVLFARVHQHRHRAQRARGDGPVGRGRAQNQPPRPRVHRNRHRSPVPAPRRRIGEAVRRSPADRVADRPSASINPARRVSDASGAGSPGVRRSK